ncbi:Akap5, partial [Symbiodinium sp. CCMP2592]
EQATKGQEQATKGQEQATKGQEQATKGQEQATKGQEQATKGQEQATKGQEQATKGQEQATKGQEQATKGQEQATKGQEQATKGQEQATKGQEQATKGQEQATKGQEKATKGQEQATKGQEQATKGQEQATKGQEQATKGQEQAAKGQEQATKGQEQATKGQEQATKGQEQATKGQDQATKGQEQATKGQEQATKGQEQATKDQEQATKGQEQATKGQEQATKGQKQATKGQEQATKGQEQATKGQEQATKGQEQATKGQEQATKGQEQATKGQEQATKGQEQATKGQEQATKGQEQATKGQEQATKGQEQATKGQEQATKGQEQATKDQEQATKGQEQATKGQEQATKGQEQATKGQEQATKGQEQATKGQEQATKGQDQATKATKGQEQATKGQEQATKGQEQATKGGKAYPQPVWGSKVWELKPKKTEVCGLSDKAERAYPVAGWHEFSGKVVAEINGVRILKKKKAGSGNEAVQARLHGVPGAWSQSKKAEAGTRPAQYGVPGAWSQTEEGGGGDEVRDLGPKKVKVGCLKPEEGGLQEEATTSSKDLLSEYVLGAWSQPEEDRGGDKVRGLNLKRMEAGTRPEHLSSTNIGSEVRGLNSNRKLKLKKTEVWKFKLKKTQAWKLKLKKGKDKVRILKKKKAGSGNEAVQARLHGVPGAWSQSKKAEAGTRCVLSRTRPAQYRIPGAWSQPEEGGGGDEAGTRPERLSSTNVESQVRALGPKKVKVGCLKPEEGELQEEATTGSKDLLSEYVLGAWSQPEEDGGGDKVRGLNLKRMEAGTRPEHFSSTNIGSEVRGLNSNRCMVSSWRKEKGKDKAGVRSAWPQEAQAEEDRGKNEVWKFKLKKTQAWKLKLKKGKDKVWKLKPKKTEARTIQGMEACAKAEAGTRPERLSSTNVESQVRDLGPKKVKVGCLKPEEGELQEEATTGSKDLLSEYVLGAWSQPEEDGGGDKAGVPILNQYGVPGAQSQLEEDGGGNQDGGEERPECLSSTKIGKDKAGVRSAWPQEAQAEEDRGKNEVWKFKLKKTQAWKLKLKKGKDKAGRVYHQPIWVSKTWGLKLQKRNDKVRILKKKKAGSGNEAVQARLHGVPGAWAQSKKAEAGTRPAQYGVPGAWSQPEEGGGGELGCESGGGDEAGALILNQYGVGDLGPKKVKVGCLKPEEGELQEEATTGSKDLLSEYVLGAWSQPEEDGGGDKAGSPILNCHGFPGPWSGENRSRDQAGVPILKQYGVPGARSQLEEDGGGNQAGALVLNQYRVRGAWSQLAQDGGEERPEYLCKDKAGRAHPQPTWGSEVRKFKLKKTQVWKFKLKKTEAWKLKLKKGKDKAWKLKLKKNILNQYGFPRRGVEAQAEEDRGKDKAWKLKLKKGKNKAWKLKLKETEAWKLKLKKGKNKVWKLEPKKTEARTRPGVKLKRKKTEAWTLKRKKTEARRRPGVDAQAEEDGGKDQAWKLKRKKTEARTRRTLKETESPKASHGECKEYARYLGIDPGYEGEETHNAMLCPSLGPAAATEPGNRRRGAAATLILNQNGGQGEEGAAPARRGAAATLILNQNDAYPVPGEEVQP